MIVTYEEMYNKSKKYVKVAIVVILIGVIMNLTNSHVKLEVGIAGHNVSAWIGDGN